MNLPSSPILNQWRLTNARRLSETKPQWCVTRAGKPLVLRRLPADYPDIEYELSLLRTLKSRGWPVPHLLDQSDEEGHWLLFEWLPGEALVAEDAQAQRSRGRQLAELHATMAELGPTQQRAGYQRIDEIVADSRLDSLLPKLAERDPDTSRILQWHLEQTRQAFTEHRLESVPQHVIHSDFARWNLLLDDNRLSGIIDFDGAHHNFRVADFAMSWRGAYDNVIEGYETVTRLSDLELYLLAPTFWGWLFMGVADAIDNIVEGDSSISLQWQVKHLVRRSPRFGPWASPYENQPSRGE